MTAIYTRDKITPERLAEAFYPLSRRQKKHMVDLMAWLLDRASTGRKQTDPEETREFKKSFLELITPESHGAVGNLEEGVTPEAKKKLRHWRENVGQTIRRYRMEKKWTQSNLARKSGLPQSHVSRLETGKHAASYLTIQRIADALGVSPSAIDPGLDG
jgi:ribosome-binding protein aMBF1 (putative translation factor)